MIRCCMNVNHVLQKYVCVCMNYWMFSESLKNFEITKDNEFTLYGVESKYRRRAKRMQPNDRALFYVKGIRKWTAIVNITSACFTDRSPVWDSEGDSGIYPYRVNIEPYKVLNEKDYIDALILAPTLEYVKRWPPEDWPLAFYDRLHLIPRRDFVLIESEMNKIIKEKYKDKRRRKSKNPY